jgi:putative endonuclease
MSNFHAKEVGEFGEGLVIKYLERKGYQIKEKNLKLSYQEIDIVAFEKKELVIIEVKTRTDDSCGVAEESIGREKIRNIKRATRAYCKLKNIDIDNTRFDVVVVNIDRKNKIAKIKHYIRIF